MSQYSRGIFACALAVQFLFDSVPHRNRGWAHTGVTGSDGSMVLFALTRGKEELRAAAEQGQRHRLMVMAQRGQAERALEVLAREVASAPDDLEATNCLMIVQLLAEHWQDARATGRQLLADPRLRTGVSPYFPLNVALAHVMVGGPADLAEADRLSEEAMESVGWRGEAQGIRAIVLAALYRDHEADVLARHAIERGEQPSDRAWSHVVLSELAARSGDVRMARLHHRMAFKLDAKVPLLDPVVRERVFGPRSRPVAAAG